mgnify:CR=1 FL=1
MTITRRVVVHCRSFSVATRRVKNSGRLRLVIPAKVLSQHLLEVALLALVFHEVVGDFSASAFHRCRVKRARPQLPHMHIVLFIVAGHVGGRGD